jgi:hypothetical protein
VLSLPDLTVLSMKIYVGIYTNSSSMIIIDWITDEKTFIKKKEEEIGEGEKGGLCCWL